ncbi:MAG: PIN domain-containing protein [Nanoarchaeota archaeon]|nr:PIN domain-containing protein [Nanoarchaeota archaeon]MBU1270535.1 PIN domain-containing protein [Nanoarchaeota archaeon]MBU1604614.1 PIN domain-containing protein [Nanoarchaeota archaeon]MBU2442764.1 PIN domain-containing protein [Nanoarchaeota archaeon]
MDLVIDANVLFSVLIKRGKTEELILHEDIQVFAPEFIFEEFDKYAKLIIKKTERSKEELEEILDLLKKKIKTIPNEETEKHISEAKIICPDENDVEYFALALKLRCPIWSQDKALKQQKIITVYSTEELNNMFQ